MPGDSVTSDTPPNPPRERPGDERPGDFIGPYRLLAFLDEGGFGTVWHAERRHPFVQTVALKVIKPGMDSKAVIARFEQERQTLALMDHPNIAKVLDGGLTPAGRPFFVMELVKGEPINEFCDRHRLSVRERLALFIHVCEAVQHAHTKGVIHRDIKPSNILVSIPDASATGRDSERSFLAKVIDFGVAKAISHTHTRESIFIERGQLIGTPEYMSPEQAEMGATDIDTRADVYSLGVVLYELLAGAPPFNAQVLRKLSLAEIQRIIREVDPPTPSRRFSALDAQAAERITRARGFERDALARTLRRELEWIPMYAMRKDRTRRYATPLDLAKDCHNYLAGLPLLAAPESTAYVLSKFMRRNRGPLLAGAVVFATLLGATVLSTSLFFRADKSAREALRAGDRARAAATSEEAAKLDAQGQAYAANIAAASSALSLGHAAEARRRLALCPTDLRGWEWNVLTRSSDSSLAHFDSQYPYPTLALLPDSRSLVVAGGLGCALWDLLSTTRSREDGIYLPAPGTRGNRAVALALSPDGSLLLAEDTDVSPNDLWVLERETLKPLYKPARGDLFTHPATRAFSPDSQFLCLRRTDPSNIVVLDARTGAPRALLPGAPACAFTADSAAILTASTDLTRFELSAKAQPSRESLAHLDTAPEAIFPSPSGSKVLIAGPVMLEFWDLDTRARLWTVPGTTRHAVFHWARPVIFVAINSDLRALSETDGATLATFRGHADPIMDVLLARESDRLISVSQSGEVRVWDAALRDTLANIPPLVRTLAVSPDSARLLIHSVAPDRPLSAFLLDTTAPARPRPLATHMLAATFSPAHDEIIAIDDASRLVRLDARTGEPLSSTPLPPPLAFNPASPPRAAALDCDPSGERLIVRFATGADAPVALVDARDARIVRSSTLPADFDCPARWSPSGHHVAFVGTSRIQVLTAALDETVADIDPNADANCLAFDPAGQRLAAGLMGGDVVVLEIGSAQPARLHAHRGECTAVAWTPAPERLITAGTDHTVVVWDWRTQERLLTLEHQSDITSMVLSPDGRTLFVATLSGEIRQWRTAP